jgi:hypothetical protein
MDSTQKQEQSSRDAEPSYYLPAAPTLSSEPGRIEQLLQKLFRRRGALRPVARLPGDRTPKSK